VATRHPRALTICGLPGSAPLLTDRPARAGRATAYVCRGTVCGPPIVTAEELATALAGVSDVSAP